ncbi:syntaxin-5 [Gilbertella persicaria]|uniref:syntaxin-5 n=1 Tax=Gilbertella persicaria TaxID=101096 RepID=UPI0022207FA6|nr:syntaxin-5 [Gilbertella persicaria]KAI8088043.1 syntaxin-5 [Gilbertella persicaria]
MKDRTSEFYALVERIKKRSTVKTRTSPLLASKKTASEFSRMSAQLGRNIASTFEKLDQLTYLTKKQPDTTEINTLTLSIKQDITKLNQRIKILQTVQQGQKISKQASEHSNNVVVSLQNKLANASLGFKDILESEVQHTEQRIPVQTTSPQPRRRVNAATQDIYDDSPQSLGIPMISQHQQQEQVMMETNDRRIETRTNTMEAIESTIAELGSIFQQLATMVAEQRETIQRIDQNTEDIEMNVLGAQSELLKYYKNISTNRSLIIKVFLTIIMFFLLFTFIM